MHGFADCAVAPLAPWWTGVPVLCITACGRRWLAGRLRRYGIAAPHWWHPVSWGCTGADAVCLRSQMASRLHGGVNSFSNFAHLFTALERLCARLPVTFVTGVTGSERCLAPRFWRLASVEQLTGKPDFALSWRAGWWLKRLLKLRCFSPFLNHPCTLSASRSRTIWKWNEAVIQGCLRASPGAPEIVA